MDIETRYLANVFSKKPIVFTRGKGALLWDINGKEYVDCSSSYGVAALGHCHPKIVVAVKAQAEQLITLHGCYYNDKRAEFTQKLVNITPKGLDKAFLSNSGAESVECAIKLARKATGKTEIIAVMGAYHGKTMGALSLTWDKKYREPFMPLVPDIKHVAPDNADKIREAITDKTAAVILEPIRGEGGIRVPPDGFLQQVREICLKKVYCSFLMWFCRVMDAQAKLFGCQKLERNPDIMCQLNLLRSYLSYNCCKRRLWSTFKIGEIQQLSWKPRLFVAAGFSAIDAFAGDTVAGKAAVNVKIL